MAATAWMALVALAFTGSQAWIARRKLQFDLFAKRYEVWEAFNDATSGWWNQIAAERAGRPVEDPWRGERETWRQKRLMLVLFPPEIHRRVETVQDALRQLTNQSVDAVEAGGVPEPAERTAARLKARMLAEKKYVDAQEALSHLVAPYIRQQYGLWKVYGVPFPRRLHGGLRRIPSTLRRR